MCGIIGFAASTGNEVDIVALERARDSMVHRGPDDCGTFRDAGVLLGHRRLSIIDLGGGHQPMSAGHEAAYIVFNGEIYNFRELRDELKLKGYSFRTNSDTEVILNLYLDCGVSAFEKLNGIFAFAIWDRRSRVLHIVRDQMGVKPLYYALTTSGLVFASEIKALFEMGVVAPELDAEAIPEYLVFRDVSGERTLFRGIHRLLPGHHLSLANGKVAVRQYWRLGPSEQEPFRGSFGEAVDALEVHLDDAVRMQMVSDVPLGTFCSGGVDSSLITALAARHATGPIDTFSVGFEEADFDESRFARQVARHVGTRHHELRLDRRDFASTLGQMIWHNDEPLHFANSVHIRAVSELARKHVTVVLTGEGADELFGGYPRYQIPALLRRWKRLPKVVRAMFLALFGVAGDHRLQKLDRFMSLPPDLQMLTNSAVADIASGDARDDLDRAISGYRRRALESSSGTDDGLNRLSLLDQHTYLVSILNRQDKMSMATSIESRVPFLDTRIVRFANSLPVAYKQARFDNKRVVKALALRYLPSEVIKRRKSGFGVPLADWFRREDALGGLAKAHYGNGLADSVFGTSNLNRLHAEHQHGRVDHSDVLWAALNLALWQEAFSVSGEYHRVALRTGS